MENEIDRVTQLKEKINENDSAKTESSRKHNILFSPICHRL